MKTIQKIFTIILLIIFTGISTGVVNAMSVVDAKYDYEYNYEDILEKEVIITKAELKKVSSLSKYIPKIDKIIENIKDKKESLLKLQSKLYELENKLYKKETKEPTKYVKYFTLIDYLQAKVSLALYKLDEIEKEKSESQAKIKVEEMKNSNLTESEKKKVEEKLVKIQLNLLNSANSGINSILKDFEKYTNYQEKGDFKINFNFDHELVGKIKANLELENYKSKVSGFDSQFSTKLKTLIEATVKGEEEFKLELNTFIDFISKDGNMYVLLEKLNIINESNDRKVKEGLEMLKKIASKNKYIKFEDRNTKQALEVLKNINPSKIFADSKAILENPLFEAYKKEGNKYSLVPTKYACDKFKELSAKFDPWNGNTCSDSQYERMLKELAKTGDLYIEVGVKNKLGFDAYPDYGINSFNSYIIFTDNNIEKIHSQLVAKEKGEGFELSYIKNKKLTFYLNAGDDVNIDFKSELTNSNKFKYIDFVYDVKGYMSDINAKLKLENKKINGGFEYNYSSYAGYDRETYKSKYNKHNISMSLSGRQDSRNNLQDFNIKVKGTNLDTKQKTFDGQFNKQAKDYYIIAEAYNEGKTIFKSNLKLKNEKINGETIVYKDSEEYVKIFSTGKYSDNYLDLNNKIELAESPSVIAFNSLKGNTTKARDISRKADLMRIQSILNMYFSDMGEYPTKIKGNKDLELYLYKGNLPKDTLGNIEINGCKFGYYYEVGTGESGIENYEYRLSSCMENGEKHIIGTATKSFKATNSFYINGYTTWTKKEAEEKPKNTKVETNINIEIDTRQNKNNINLYFDYIEGNKKIVELEIDNKGTIEYKKVDIKVPTNTMELNEALDIKY